MDASASCVWEFKKDREYEFEVVSVRQLECRCRNAVIPSWSRYHGCVIQLRGIDSKDKSMKKYYTQRDDACAARPGNRITGRAIAGKCDDTFEMHWPVLKPCGTIENLRTCLLDQNLNTFQ